MLMINKKVECFFDRPTQVAFFDTENKVFIGGIADGNRIICLECGGIIGIDEFLDDIEENFPEIAFPIIELNWCNLSNECLGDAMFNSSTGEIILN